MLQSQDREIKGATYRVFQLKASKALAMLVDLGRIMGPALGVLVDGAGSGGKVDLNALMSAKVGGDVFGRAAESLFSRLDNAKVSSLIAELVEVTHVNTSPGEGEKFVPLKGIYELHFSGGKMGALFAWLRFALEVQFGDFLSSWRESAPAALPTPSDSLAE